MTRKQIHDFATLVDLYHLSASDTEEIILAEGKLFFSLEDAAFLLYIPSLNECLYYSHELWGDLEQHLNPADFNITVEDAVLKITSDQRYPSAFMILPEFDAQLEKHMDITSNTAVLFSTNRKKPLFIGHRQVILRLAEDFERVDGVVSVHAFQDWRSQHA